MSEASEDMEKTENYQKVDFSGRAISLYTKSALAGVIIGLAIMTPISIAMFARNYELVGMIIQVIFIPIFLFIFLLFLSIVRLSINRYKKLDDLLSLYLLFIAPLFSGFIVLVILWLIFIDTKLGEVMFGLIKITTIALYIIVIPTAIYMGWWKHKRGLLSTFPQVIAAAERRTDEYMDGYSERPYETDISEIKLDSFLDYAKFLMKNYLIADYEKTPGAIRIMFTSTAYAIKIATPKGKDMDSWMKVTENEEATIFISDYTYKSLKVPISYHLLCLKVVERIMVAYEHFSNDDEAATLRVFAVKKGGKGK